jgi:hypothetical protein
MWTSIWVGRVLQFGREAVNSDWRAGLRFNVPTHKRAYPPFDQGARRLHLVDRLTAGPAIFKCVTGLPDFLVAYGGNQLATCISNELRPPLRP